MDIKTALVNATITHFENEKAKNEAELLLYLENGVGVGDHSDVIKDIINKVEGIEHANSCLEQIRRMLEKAKEDV